MKRDLEVAEGMESGPMDSQRTRTTEDIVASRAIATDRIFKGGSLSVLGFGCALLMDLLNITPGIGFWIGLGTSLIAFGAGAVWAGTGASHLMRHGRRGSSLWLISLAGLGGSVIVNVVSGMLWGPLTHPILGGLNRLAMVSCGLFTLALIILGLITIVRWMLPNGEPPDL